MHRLVPGLLEVSILIPMRAIFSGRFFFGERILTVRTKNLRDLHILARLVQDYAITRVLSLALIHKASVDRLA